MVRGVNEAGEASVYAFSGLGVLVASERRGVRRDYVTDLTSECRRVLMEIDDELTVRYTYGVVRNSVNIAPTAGSGESVLHMHLHTDRLGSTRFATHGSGAVLGWVSYDAWGSRTGGVDMAVAVLGGDAPILRGIVLQNYTGHRFDDVLGLYFAQARMYDPVTRQKEMLYFTEK